jgi:LysM repeat protein
MNVRKILIFGLINILFPILLQAQQEVVVKKSEIIENINGKQFYMHFIKQGETLFEIAKVYGVEVDDIYDNNPGAKTSIKTGQILKIPYAKPENIANKKGTNAENYFLYTVKSKETLYGISKKYGVEIEEIKSLNPGMGASVAEGQSIKIPHKKEPGKSESAEQSGQQFMHTVQAGETLYSISRIYDVSVNDIKTANPTLNESLNVGQEIIISGKGSLQDSQSETNKIVQEQNSVKSHKVATGETLYSISKKYGVDTDEIKKLNPTLKETLTLGQILVIPAKSGTNNFIYYTAEKNDKLQSIALKYGVSYSELAALNPDLQKKITKGQKVKIPLKKEDIHSKQTKTPLVEDKAPANSFCQNHKKNMQATYKIALMLPLYLEQVDSIGFTTEMIGADYKELDPLKFIQFYEGFIMAVDSMKKQGLKLNLYVYDVDNSTLKINSILNKPELTSMDLIIGPFYAESFKKMADFANNHKIKIVNPLSTREELINGNPFVFKLKPSVIYQAEQIANFIVEEHSESNIILVRQNRYKFQEEVSYIKNYLNSHRTSSSYIKNREILAILDSLKTDKILTDNTLITRERVSKNINETTYAANTVKEIIISDDSASNLRSSLSHLRNNFIIIMSDEKVFCQDLMSQLNKMSENYRITLCGLPEWKKFNELETQYLVNMNTHFLVPALVNYNDYQVKKWIENFRKFYATEPAMNLYAFDGFDTGWYFLNALFLYGNDFEKCLDDFEIHLIQTKFNFEHLKGSGYQNTCWNIGRYYNYQFIPAVK